MTNSRQQILQALRRDQRPFPAAKPPETYQPMVPLGNLPASEVQALFIQNAQKAACIVHRPASDVAAFETLMQVVGGDETISCWEPDLIPLNGLEEALQRAGIGRVGEDASVRVGLTGVDAALAATGSLVLSSGKGRFRTASLLPPIHVAVLSSAQIMPDLEHWWAEQRATGLDLMRQSSNIVVITGPSRTADIAMQLVMGMHGPRELHIILLEGSS